MGVIQNTPLPDMPRHKAEELARSALAAWSAKRILDSVNETARAFVLPLALFDRLGVGKFEAYEGKLASTHQEIEDAAFDLCGFSKTDRISALCIAPGVVDAIKSEDADEECEGDFATAPNQTEALLSWMVGVAFGRFDWRLATGERTAPPEPDPFDPLPAKSAGMLPDGADPFHDHPGILVDLPGHKHDLARLIEQVLIRVDTPIPPDIRRWLQRDFFPFHLQRYSKSRRKAPIYWPLATTTGSYTLWLYYPSLTSQTLYTAVNDFIEPKLKQVSQEAATLRTQGTARSRDQDRALDAERAQRPGVHVNHRVFAEDDQPRLVVRPQPVQRLGDERPVLGGEFRLHARRVVQDEDGCDALVGPPALQPRQCEDEQT